MTVRELLARIDSEELSEWMAFYNVEPFGSDTQYVGPAISTAAIINTLDAIAGGPGDIAKPTDFMPGAGNEKTQSLDEMLQMAQIITLANGGKDLREETENDG
jgi:hypothetical protein